MILSNCLKNDFTISLIQFGLESIKTTVWNDMIIFTSETKSRSLVQQTEGNHVLSFSKQ